MEFVVLRGLRIKVYLTSGHKYTGKVEEANEYYLRLLDDIDGHVWTILAGHIASFTVIKDER